MAARNALLPDLAEAESIVEGLRAGVRRIEVVFADEGVDALLARVVRQVLVELLSDALAGGAGIDHDAIDVDEARQASGEPAEVSLS